MAEPPRDLDRLLDVLAHTAPDELDCEQTLTQLAAYFEALESGLRGGAFARVEQHLAVCPCCSAQLEALVEALRAAEEEPS